jgi:hypothetical protein
VTSQGADSAVPDWEEKISTNLLNRIQQSKGRASFFDAGVRAPAIASAIPPRVQTSHSERVSPIISGVLRQDGQFLTSAFIR